MFFFSIGNSSFSGLLHRIPLLDFMFSLAYAACEVRVGHEGVIDFTENFYWIKIRPHDVYVDVWSSDLDDKVTCRTDDFLDASASFLADAISFLRVEYPEFQHNAVLEKLCSLLELLKK